MSDWVSEWVIEWVSKWHITMGQFSRKWYAQFQAFAWNILHTKVVLNFVLEMGLQVYCTNNYTTETPP